MYMDDPLKRKFYIEMCKIEKWSVRTFKERIQSMLYERTALSKKPDKAIQDDLALLKNEQKLDPDLVFRDPYFLEFLGLKNTFRRICLILELSCFNCYCYYCYTSYRKCNNKGIYAVIR